jgi:hypothetical protein
MLLELLATLFRIDADPEAMMPTGGQPTLLSFLAGLFRLDSSPQAMNPAGKLTYEQVTMPRI